MRGLRDVFAMSRRSKTNLQRREKPLQVEHAVLRTNGKAYVELLLEGARAESDQRTAEGACRLAREASRFARASSIASAGGQRIRAARAGAAQPVEPAGTGAYERRAALTQREECRVKFI